MGKISIFSFIELELADYHRRSIVVGRGLPPRRVLLDEDMPTSVDSVARGWTVGMQVSDISPVTYTVPFVADSAASLEIIVQKRKPLETCHNHLIKATWTTKCDL